MLFYLSIKSFIERPDWRKIERNVPMGISFRGEGTITVNSSFWYF